MELGQQQYEYWKAGHQYQLVLLGEVEGGAQRQLAIMSFKKISKVGKKILTDTLPT